MSTFGINSQIHGKEDFLTSLAEDFCLPALFLLEDGKSSKKGISNFNNVLRKYPEELIDRVQKLSIKERKDIASDLFQIYSNISELPIRGLIHPKNMGTLNRKISQISFETPIKTFENQISKQKEFSCESSKGEIKFKKRDVRELSLSIIRLNWFFNDKEVFETNSKESPFSKTCLKFMKATKDVSKTKNFLIGHAKKNKRILKSNIEKIPLENLSHEDFHFLLESLSLNIESLFFSLNEPQLEKLIRNYRLYRNLDYVKPNWANLPIYFLYSFEPTGSMEKTLRKCQREGFTRLKHLRFLDMPYENLIKNENVFFKFIEILNSNFRNWKFN